MRRFSVVLCLTACLTACARESGEASAVELVRSGAPEACSHPDTRAALSAHIGAGQRIQEITFSGADAERLRVRCEAKTAGGRVAFEVAENLAQAGRVTVIVAAPLAGEAVAAPTSSAPPPVASSAASTGPAVARGHTFDVPENYPTAFALWRRQVRALPANERDWVHTLKGTAGPVRQVSVGDRDYLLGWVCEPHNCGGNEALIMIQPDQSRVFGLVRLTGSDRSVTDHLVGEVSAGERRCLIFYLEDRSDAGRCT